jgi:hypothetical protein
MNQALRAVTYLHLAIDGIATPDPTCGSAACVVTPVGTPLAVGTISGHVAGITTNSANDAGGVVLPFGAVVFAMANLTAVLTSLVFVVSESSVERGEFSELVTLELVLAFGNRSCLKRASVSEEIKGNY